MSRREVGCRRLDEGLLGLFFGGLVVCGLVVIGSISFSSPSGIELGIRDCVGMMGWGKGLGR